MKKRILILLGILIIGGGAAAGVCWKMGVFSQQETSGDSVYVTKISDLTGQTSGVSNRYAGVVEPQETVSVELESGRTVKEVQVKTGDQVKKGQLLFEYDLSSIQESLEEAQLDLDRLKNEASSLNERIATLEKEKKKASQDNQLSYTIEIETNKMNLKKNEYSQKSKQAEIDKLQSATGNTEVRSSIDGVIQKIDTSKLTTEDNSSVDDTDSGDFSQSDDSSSGGSNAFITILSTGAYRIKGTVNELNVNSIVEGEPVIIRSRVDDSQTWKGTMGTVDKDSASSGNNNNSFYGMTDSSDSQTSTSTYPFYVNLDSSDGLMLGQHVYIEMDEGQESQKTGIWLSEVYIVDADTDSPYVWAADKKGKLEKRSVILGQHDEELGEYEIADGLSKDDCIAYPSDILEEGMSTTTNIEDAMDTGNIDMQPLDDSSFSEDPLPDTADTEGVSEYEMSDDGTVVDDPEAVPVLKDVNFSMEEGEYVAIMGPSGSGKTTLMNIIGCLDKPTEGKFFLDGQDILNCSENDMSDIRLNKIGFVFQSFHLLPRQSALANVELPLNYAKVPKKERRERAMKALERVGLADRVDFQPNQLSGGQMQRVAIARAIVNNPKLLLADEPTGALDSKSGAQVMELFQKLNDEGVTVLMITHDPDIAAHAKRVVMIRDGELKEKEVK